MSLVHSPSGVREAAASRRSLVLRMLRDPMTAAGLVILTLLLGLALLGPILVANDPLAVNMAHRLQPPSLQYPLGTDSMGRCLFSRLAAGAQTTLGIPVLVLAMVLAIGIPAGLLAGYAGGRIDALLMRTVDGMSVVPDFLLVIAVSGFLGPSLNNLILSIVLINWCGYARLIRGIVLSEREKDYVLAARVAGGRVGTILRRHLLPQVVSPVLVYAALDLGKTILVISSMSYLGLGAQPPSPEWGAMLNEGRSYFQTHPELMIYPGMAVLLVVVSFNLIGEGLRDLLDVRGRG
ncbi:nickel transporter permease [Paenibacillus sp. S-38]|uniref:nickel transporter permease n=1 Tax=Paenibacillus sp. S-38 TaxID=3416710 RepID=UPI003CF2A2E9